MGVKKTTVVEILRIIATIITAIITALTVQSCTASISILKNNTNSNSETHQSAEAKADSTGINVLNK